MDIKRVGILRGGTWDNYEKSLNDGGKIISHIFENISDKWKPIDILIDMNGNWYLSGLPILPSQLMNKVDVVWNTSHPSYSKILSDLSIPNIGTNSFSKILESKEILKEHMKKIGVSIPRSIVIPVYQKDFDGILEEFAVKKAKEIHEKFGAPWVVKSLTIDTSIGIHIAKSFPELIDAIIDCAKHNKSILVEEFIFGKNASVHSVSNFRGENLYNFPPVENRNGLIVSPGKFSISEKEKLIELTNKIFEHTNTAQYLKLNFIIHPRSIYLNDVEFFPNLSIDSCFSKSCESVGTTMHSVIEHILAEAKV